MSDKIRGAIFNMLGDLGGLRVLDAFGGSGALSIEAVSRGAESAVSIDIDKQAYQTIITNINKLGLEGRIRAVRQNVATWSRDTSHEIFDVVLADPPYDAPRVSTITLLAAHVKSGGLLVLSWPGSEVLPELPHMKLISTKSYGDAQLGIYRR